MAGLGLKFWTSPPVPSKELLNMTGSAEGEVVLNPGPAEDSQKQPLCSIQITSEKGALCIINPLFLDEHGDGWLALDPPGPRGSQMRPTMRLKNSQRNRGIGKVKAKKISIASVPSTQGEENSPAAVQPEEKEMERSFPDKSVENALAKCLLKPLRAAIYSQLLEFHTRDGSLKKLRENQKKMKAQSLPQLGVTAAVPDEAAMDKILQKLLLMHSHYSPKEKVIQLLKVCKLIYEAMNRVPGKKEVYGADDFLPVLTYVLLGCDITFLQLDVEYMMELLDPSQLQGEGGYYLTTVFGALYHIGNIQHTTVTRQISLEAQRSLHQWQRRRTIHHGSSSSHKSQDLLYVSLREPFNNQKVLTVPSDMTTASVCAVCRQKFQIQDKEDYGLFLIENNEIQQLENDSFPQQVKAELLKAGASSIVFVFKQKTGALP
ncbi:ras and Rab interactor-like protein isoform X2 [Pleurodeles waltl]|uniref:ras and Rab interactor-like protein isoform X2 n=1 Tax=Pleurodeles waltl TaxID=8319 RepID=UPI00370974F6